LVASGRFGDGAAAVVTVGANRPEPGSRVLDSRSHRYPDSQRTMGWDVGVGGLKIVLDAQVPALVQQYLGGGIRSFLAAHSLRVDDVGAWVPVLLANFIANLTRNVWSHTIIFCGRFPDGLKSLLRSRSRARPAGSGICGNCSAPATLIASRCSTSCGNLSHQIEHHLFPDLPATAPKSRPASATSAIAYNTAPLTRQTTRVWKRILRLSLPRTEAPLTPDCDPVAARRSTAA
jgi:hypothetical protein